ncbi:ZIP family metal transporter [candidate division SR1 bacterium]|nr:ZIP family metal transporter [candidate division SR1 bacterium]
MPTNLRYAIISVFLISLISLIGIATFSIQVDKLRKILIYFIAFSAGTLMGDAFLHLLPEAVEEFGFETKTGLSILAGILIGLISEKVIYRNHCHLPITNEHKHPFAWMNLIGDMVHNLMDGIIIGIAFIGGIEIGIATTIAVILHEIPQEIGDFGVLIHGGFSKKKALILNFMTALTAFVGLTLAYLLDSNIEGISAILTPLAAGLFIYIAGSDLIPELHKHSKLSQSIVQIFLFVCGVGVMIGLVFAE